MSHYSRVTTKIVRRDLLIKALNDMGYGVVEQHDQPQPLVGYRGDQRADRAHIIVRRQHISYYSNDLGFLQMPDGTFQAIISDYDKRHFFPETWLHRLMQAYSGHVVADQMEAQGFVLDQEYRENGTIRRTYKKARGYA
ncbi:MAG: DUF1257 domain-containing protein [Herpetosiphon sp.]|nr:DUF1257 domain-containing protein [Herpetosiphon sp.]